MSSDLCHGHNSAYLAEVANFDLCSFYEFDHPFMCSIPESQLRLSRDRGLGLICDNKLAGLLSIIIPTSITNSTDMCARTLKTYSYYTNVALYEKWIHNVIGVNTPPHTANGKPISIIPNSSPYQSTFCYCCDFDFYSNVNCIISLLFSDFLTVTNMRPTNTASIMKSSSSIVSLIVTWLLIHKFTVNWDI